MGERKKKRWWWGRVPFSSSPACFFFLLALPQRTAKSRASTARPRGRSRWRTSSASRRDPELQWQYTTTGGVAAAAAAPAPPPTPGGPRSGLWPPPRRAPPPPQVRVGEGVAAAGSYRESWMRWPRGLRCDGGGEKRERRERGLREARDTNERVPCPSCSVLLLEREKLTTAKSSRVYARPFAVNRPAVPPTRSAGV